jgi:hypothetical protein
VLAGIGLRKSEVEQILDDVGMNADGEVRGSESRGRRGGCKAMRLWELRMSASAGLV